MLKQVPVGRRRVDAYTPSARAEAVAGLRKLAAALRGVRVLHVNATPYGGGVAEILRSECLCNVTLASRRTGGL